VVFPGSDRWSKGEEQSVTRKKKKKKKKKKKRKKKKKKKKKKCVGQKKKKKKIAMAGRSPMAPRGSETARYTVSVFCYIILHPSSPLSHYDPAHGESTKIYD
jgi:hypothetical protein